MHSILTLNRIKSEIFLEAGPGTGLQDSQASHAFPVFVGEGTNSLLTVTLCLLDLRLLKMKRKLSTDLPFNGQVFSARLVDKKTGDTATFCCQALQRKQLLLSSFHNTVGGCWVCAVINRGIGSSSRLHIVCVSHWLGRDLEAGC